MSIVRRIAPAAALSAFAPPNAAAADGAALFDGASGLAIGSGVVLALMGALTFLILTTRRLSGSSLFNRLFIVVASTSAFFSAISSAIGFSLITSQETTDFFRNAFLPPAFGVFVFFLAVAIWIGGAELVRHRDWFRGLGNGPVATMLHFIERSVKIFVIIPILSIILFAVSTWTTVVGIAGVDAVRLTYSAELERLQSECAAIAAWRQKDLAVLADLKLSVRTTALAAAREREGGFQTGSAGRGAVAAYIEGVAAWYQAVEEGVAAALEADDPSGLSPFSPNVCATISDELRSLLAADAFANYDKWASAFETAFNDFAIVLNRWRQDRRIEQLLQAQLDAFDRANPKPVAGISPAQERAINAYADEVTGALKKFLSAQRRNKPSVPQRSAAELSPERGLEIIAAHFRNAPAPVEVEKPKKTRDAATLAAERIPGLSEMTPRDAVLKHAQVFSDVWALGVAWDYASYVLMLAFLFFPSAERAAGRKDD
ncbi:MAG: hypothetical protein HXY21_03470 [Parvularculaceae bacterium]|nr:hypothetical protein [Parvularculaceae bacterium]